jgi:hypothetical protein
MRRGVTIAVVGLAAMVAAAPVALGHGGPRGFDGPKGDQPGHQRPFLVRGVAAGDATATGVQVSVGQGWKHHLFNPSRPGRIVTVAIDAGTHIRKVGVTAPTFADLKAGDRLLALVVPNGSTAPGTTPAADAIVDLGPATPVTARFEIRGTVAANATQGAVTVNVLGADRDARAALAGATSVQVSLGSATEIRKRGVDAATFADLKAGDRVKVVWQAPAGTALASLGAAAKVRDFGPPLPVPFEIRGVVAADAGQGGVQVTALGGNHQARLALAGVTSVMVKLDPSTRIVTRQGVVETFADLKAGDRVRVVWWAARGTTASNLPAASRVRDRGPGV